MADEATRVDTFPEEVQRFIVDNLSSVEELEVLLLLRSRPDKEWNAAEVSQALYTQPAAAAMRLNDLRSHGLLTSRKEASELYRYHPRTADLEPLVSRLSEAYRERRVAVITLIYSKASSQVQAFADAFKLRKDP